MFFKTRSIIIAVVPDGLCQYMASTLEGNKMFVFGMGRNYIGNKLCSNQFSGNHENGYSMSWNKNFKHSIFIGRWYGFSIMTIDLQSKVFRK